MSLVPFGKFKNSLKFESRGNGSGIIAGPVYGNNQWVGLRGDNEVMTSTDGVNWSPAVTNIPIATVSTQDEIASFRFINNLFIAVIGGETTSSTKIFYSSDAITWNVISNPTINGHSFYTSPGVYSRIHDISYINGQYVFVGRETTGTGEPGQALIATSTNLTAWTKKTISYSGSYSELNRIAVDNYKMVVAGYYQNANETRKYPLVYDSTNGTNWTLDAIGGVQVATGHDSSLQSISTNGYGSWLAVGKNGSVYNSTGLIYGSAFGQSITSADIVAITYFKNTWMIFGVQIDPTTNIRTFSLLTTPDQANWTTHTLPQLNGIAGFDILAPDRYGHVEFAQTADQAVVFDYTTTDATTFNLINYTIPNQQPYLDYTADPKWASWQTMDFWVYIEANTTSDYVEYPIASQINGYNNDGWSVVLVQEQNGRKPQVVVTANQAGTNGWYASSSWNVTTGGTINFAQWNHIRVVKNGTVGAIYVNGIQENGNFTFPSTWPNSGSLNIGRIGNGYESQFARPNAYWIDEFMMNRLALNTPSSPSITVPTERYYSTDQMLLLLHFDYNYLDDTNRPITADSPLATDVTLTATATRILKLQSQQQVDADLTAQPIRVKQFQANLQVDAIELVAVARTRSTPIDLTVDASLTATALRIKQLQSLLQAAADLTATAKKYNGTSANLTVDADLTSTTTRIKQLQANLTVDAFELAATTRIGQGLIDLQTTATLQATTIKTARAQANLTIDAGLQAQADKLRRAQAQLDVQVDLEADIGKTKEFYVNLAVEITSTQQARKTTNTQAILTVDATAQAIATRTRTAQATLTVDAALQEITQEIRSAQADLQTIAQLEATSGNVVRAEANLQVQAFELTYASVIRYDRYYKLIIEPETRLLTIDSETRVNIIKDKLL